MTEHRPILHLVAGKIAAGKSTLCAELAKAPGTVLLAEDDWLARLYPDEITSLAEFVDRSGRLRGPLGDHVIQLLRAGMDVVLDFHANTVERRAWMRSLVESAGAIGRLHFLDVPDEICKARLRRRNEAGTHAFAASEEQFDQFTRYFVAPSADDGLEIVSHGGKEDSETLFRMRAERGDAKRGLELLDRLDRAEKP